MDNTQDETTGFTTTEGTSPAKLDFSPKQIDQSIQFDDSLKPLLSSTYNDGEVVVASTKELYAKTTTAGSPAVYGIYHIGRVAVRGKMVVRAENDVTYAVGDMLSTSTTSGRVTKSNANPIAIALEAHTAGSAEELMLWAYVCRVGNLANAHAKMGLSGNQTTAGAQVTFDTSYISSGVTVNTGTYKFEILTGGTYRISSCLRLDGTASNELVQFTVLKNSAAEIARSYTNMGGGAYGDNSAYLDSGPIILAVGDTIYFNYSSSGGAHTLMAAENLSWASIVQIA